LSFPSGCVGSGSRAVEAPKCVFLPNSSSSVGLLSSLDKCYADVVVSSLFHRFLFLLPFSQGFFTQVFWNFPPVASSLDIYFCLLLIFFLLMTHFYSVSLLVRVTDCFSPRYAPVGGRLRAPPPLGVIFPVLLSTSGILSCALPPVLFVPVGFL